jgi:hypothetical protein
LALSDTEILMSPRSALIAVIAAVTLAGSAHAEVLQPIQAHTLDLGSISGVAYYTVEKDGHRLVVFLKAAEMQTPVRFIATLAPEQQVTLSVQRRAGEPPMDVHFVRHGEKIEVNAAGPSPHLETRDE